MNRRRRRRRSSSFALAFSPVLSCSWYSAAAVTCVREIFGIVSYCTRPEKNEERRKVIKKYDTGPPLRTDSTGSFETILLLLRLFVFITT